MGAVGEEPTNRPSVAEHRKVLEIVNLAELAGPSPSEIGPMARRSVCSSTFGRRLGTSTMDAMPRSLGQSVAFDVPRAGRLRG